MRGLTLLISAIIGLAKVTAIARAAAGDLAGALAIFGALAAAAATTIGLYTLATNAVDDFTTALLAEADAAQKTARENMALAKTADQITQRQKAQGSGERQVRIGDPIGAATQPLTPEQTSLENAQRRHEFLRRQRADLRRQFTAARENLFTETSQQDPKRKSLLEDWVRKISAALDRNEQATQAAVSEIERTRQLAAEPIPERGRRFVGQPLQRALPQAQQKQTVQFVGLQQLGKTLQQLQNKKQDELIGIEKDALSELKELNEQVRKSPRLVWATGVSS